MFFTKLALITVLGDKLQLLSQINLKENIPEVDGKCQWSAIEAAKVLLNDEYKPSSIATLFGSSEAKYDEEDPIEKYLIGTEEKSSVPMKACRDFAELKETMGELKNDELLIVNGESGEADHAYIIWKKADACWLIDADRGLFKMLDIEKDFIHPVLGWNEEKRDITDPKFDYLRICFISGDTPKAMKHMAPLSVCKLT